MSKRDEYVEKLKVQLDQWNTEVAKWEAKAHKGFQRWHAFTPVGHAFICLSAAD